MMLTTQAKSPLPATRTIPAWKNWTEHPLSSGMLRGAALNLASLATHAHFHLYRQGESALEKETKHKARTSKNGKLPAAIQPHCCSTDHTLMSFQPRSWDILQCSALAARCRNCSCFLVPRYHLGVRHFLGALTAVPLPSAPSASSYFCATVHQKSPLYHLPSHVCRLHYNFKPVRGHGDFQRVTGGLRCCIYAFPLHGLTSLNLFTRFPSLEVQTSQLQPSRPDRHFCPTAAGYGV